MVVQDRLWGVLIAATVNEQPLAPDTETRLASFTELVATAIANAPSAFEKTALTVMMRAHGDEAGKRMNVLRDQSVANIGMSRG